MGYTLVGWFGRRGVCRRRRVTDSRAERAAVAREGTASDTSPALIKTLQTTNFHPQSNFDANKSRLQQTLKFVGGKREGWGDVDLASAAVIRNVSGRHFTGKANC